MLEPLRKYAVVLTTGAGCCFRAFCRVTKSATRAGESALTLLVTQVLADHHDPAMTADHLALVADLLDARMNLHLPTVFIGLPRCAPRGCEAMTRESSGSGVGHACEIQPWCL